MGDESRNIRGRSAEMMPGVKEKYECIRDDECASAQKCHNNKCTPVCTAAPCPPDQYCIAQSGHARICVTCLTDSHCRAGKSCSADGACLSCSAGATGCNCPGSAPYANGSGGCVACTQTSHCPYRNECRNNTCVERVTCPDNCLQCTDSETCTRCVSGFRLIFGECRGYGCTTGQWIDGEWVEGKCL